jgi:hypothetical protein
MTFKELDKFYSENYSIGYLKSDISSRSPFENRLVLISLICHITYKTKLKNPDVTHYQVVVKLADKLGLPDKFIWGLAIICHDFSYGCSEFPTFGLKGQDMVKEVRGILKTYLPF